MYEKLVGYLLNALEADEFAHVERLLEADGDARRSLAVLRRALIPLEADREYVAAPVDLAIRTCQRIREQSVNPDSTGR